MRWQTAVFEDGVNAATTLERWLNTLEEKHCVTSLNMTAIGEALLAVVGLMDANPEDDEAPNAPKAPKVLGTKVLGTKVLGTKAEVMSILATAEAWPR